MTQSPPWVMPGARTTRFRHVAQPLRRVRLSPQGLDLGLAGLFVLAVTVEIIGEPVTDGRLALLLFLTMVMAGCVAVRRRVPLTALCLATAALTIEAFLSVATEFSPLATLVCAYSAGQYATPTRARWGALITLTGVVAFFAGMPGLAQTDPADLLSVLLIWLMAWGFGYGTARRREEQERARRALEGQVIAEERVRVSRELHDVVGHTVNLLVVQAGAARLTLDKDPARTRALLQGMENAGRATMADLDRVLATLRSSATDGSGDPAVPAPGLTQLSELVARFQNSGLDVHLSRDPDLRLPRSLDQSVYRVVQEALTNALKHAAPCSVIVRLQESPVGSVMIEVCDNGPGMRTTDRHGLGLLGIAERVSMCGGVLEYGNGRSGGFQLRAVLPLP